MSSTLISHLAAYKTICVCGSMTHIDFMESIAHDLMHEGHTVFLPQRMEQQIKYDDLRNTGQVTLLADKKEELMQAHFEKIKKSDAVVIYNEEKKGITGYIGANTLIECAYSHFLNKPLFVLNPYDQNSSRDEIAGMKPIIINQ